VELGVERNSCRRIERGRSSYDARHGTMHVHELGGAEIGRMLGVSESRASQILAGIRRKLKDRLAAYDADPVTA
jgi:hypothetical protein